jgi:hypothetical protein
MRPWNAWAVALGSALVMLAGVISTTHAQGLQLSGGVDARVTNERESGGEDAGTRALVEGAFLNLRKVWSDDVGDRWIGVAQVDVDDNARRIRPYQVYLQYKGPLGAWNVRAGHYLLPVGLLATYDTERLLLQGLEKTSLGIRKDTGVELFGRFGSVDYAASLTDGLSDIRFIDADARPMVTARIAYVRGDSQVGVSTLVGRVLVDPDFGHEGGPVRQRRVVLDATTSRGPLTVRAEAVAGTNDARRVNGGLLLGDYALTPKWELNTQYAYWSRREEPHAIGLGVSYQIRSGLLLRAADTYRVGKDNRHEFSFQIYYEFSRHL